MLCRTPKTCSYPLRNSQPHQEDERTTERGCENQHAGSAQCAEPCRLGRAWWNQGGQQGEGGPEPGLVGGEEKPVVRIRLAQAVAADLSVYLCLSTDYPCGLGQDTFLSELQFLHLKNGDNNSIYLIGLFED